MHEPRRPVVSAPRVAGVIAVGLGLLATIALTLSDRVPSLIGRAERRFDVVDALSVPGDPMTFGHFVIWGAIAFVAAMVPRTTAGFFLVVVSLLAVSFGLEVGQQVFTATRVAEVRDMQANVSGVLLGAGLGAFVAVVLRRALSTQQV
ncbi:MAG: hypothetical protein AAF548_04220 [Actinomycetota bacterium]